MLDRQLDPSAVAVHANPIRLGDRAARARVRRPNELFTLFLAPISPQMLSLPTATTCVTLYILRGALHRGAGLIFNGTALQSKMLNEICIDLAQSSLRGASSARHTSRPVQRQAFVCILYIAES